ncbi:MAG: hypothetical protein J3Q66DRAFT_400838 [Benniella sp.]|nr:MAG: hypothetical protein J3Q66DRAFT_400838 [Benniella sp.]
MKRLVKMIEAMDLSMTETREKLKTFYKTADETNALLDMWIREESRHRENQERRAAYQQAMESASIVWYPLQSLYLTQSSIPSSSTTPLSTGIRGTSETPLPFLSSQSSGCQTTTWYTTAFEEISIGTRAHGHASAIAANRKRNPIH